MDSRAVFKWPSKEVTRFRLLRLAIGLKISAPIFYNQWEAKPKSIATCTCNFSRALSSDYRRLQRILISLSHCSLLLWLVGVITLALIFQQSFKNRPINAELYFGATKCEENMIVTRALVDILNLNTAIPRSKIFATFPWGFFCGFCCCNFFGFVFYRCFDKTPACFFVVTVSLWDHQDYQKYIFPWELSICLDSHNFHDILEWKRWIDISHMMLM